MNARQRKERIKNILKTIEEQLINSSNEYNSIIRTQEEMNELSKFNEHSYQLINYLSNILRPK